MSCELCKQYIHLFSPHDVGSIILKYCGSPHISCGNDNDNIKAHSKYMNLIITDYIHRKEISTNVFFMCADDNVVKSINIRCYVGFGDAHRINYINNCIIVNNISDIVRDLNLKIYFKRTNSDGCTNKVEITKDELFSFLAALTDRRFRS